MERKLKNRRKIMNEKAKDEEKIRKEKKMNNKKILFIGILSLFLVSTIAFAEDPLQTGIAGDVYLDQGTGVENVLIEVLGTGVTGNPQPDGHYVISLNPGIYDIAFSLYNYYPDTLTNVNVISGSITTLQNITLNHIPLGDINGTVTLNGGDPSLIDQVIFLIDDNELEDIHPQIDGSYYISNIDAGQHELKAQLEGYYDSTAIVVVTDGGVVTHDFTLNARPGTITGFVTLNGTGAVNLVEFLVVETATGDTITPIDITGPLLHPDFYGYYEIIIPAGTYNVTALLTDFEPYIIQDILVIYNQVTAEKNFTLNKYPFIEGVVNLTGGTEPITEVEVTAVDTAGTTPPYTANPDDTGYYVIPNMVFGTYEVTATLDGYEEVTPVTIVVDDYIVYPQDFTLVPSDAVISGEVEITGGTGLYTNVIVQYQIGGGAWTDANYDPGTHLYDITLSYIGVTNPQDVKVKATLADYGDDENEYTDVIQADEYSGEDLILDPVDITISGEITLNGGWIKQNIPEITVTSNYGTVTGDPNADTTAYEYTVKITKDHYQGIFTALNVVITASHPDYDPQTINLTVEQGDNVPNQNMTLDAKPGFITGTLTPVGGDPNVDITGATVTAYDRFTGNPITTENADTDSTYMLTIPIVGHDMPPQYADSLRTHLIGFIDGVIDSVAVNENETTIDQDFDLVSVKINALVTIDAGFGPIDGVGFTSLDIIYSVEYIQISSDSALYVVDMDPGTHDVEATLIGYSGDYKSITNTITVPNYSDVDSNFPFILNNPIIQEFYLSQDAKESLQSVYHWIKKDGAEPEAFIAPELHAIIQGSPAALLDTILFEYQAEDEHGDLQWYEIGVIEPVNVPPENIYDVFVEWDPLPVVGNYPIRVTCWDTTVTRTDPISALINRDVRDVVIDYNRSNLTYETEIIGPNVGKKILNNSQAALTTAVLGTTDDINEVDSLKIDVINRDGGTILASVTQDNPYPIGCDSTWTWNFAHLIDDILINAGENPDDGKVNVDFNVSLYDTTGANWVWYETPLFDDIWIDKENPYLPDYDKIAITAGGNPVNITDLLLPANSSIEVKIADCHDFDLTHIDNVDVIDFFPGYLDIDDGDFEIDPVNKTITLTFNTEYEDVYWFEFTILVDDWINNNSTTKTYRFISEDLLAQMNACNIEDPIHPPVEWTDHLERDYDYRVSATGVLDYVIGVDFYHQRPSGGSGAWTFIGSDDDAPYNVENPSYDPSATPKELFEHNKYYDFIGLSTIYNTVDGYLQLTVDDIKGSAIYEVDFGNTWDNFRNAGYVKHIRYKDDSTHNLPDLYIEGLFGDPGEIIQIGPDEYVLNKEICGEWLDEVRLDPNTIPWDIRFPYEYAPYGVGKVQYYYHQDGFTTDSLIATVIDPTGLDFNLYTWNISMLNEGVYEIYALGIDNVNNTQTTINSITLTIVETADVWIEALAGKSIEAIYYDDNTLHGEVSITAKSDGTIDGFRFYTSPDGHTWELLPDGIFIPHPPDSVCTYEYWDVTELPDGPYWVGATSLENLEPPVYGVQITIDNTLDLSLTEQSIADNDILGDSTDIVLKHDPGIEDLADNAIVCYKNMHPDQDVWIVIGTPAWDYEGKVTVTLDTNIPNWNDGFYEFEIIAQDKAIPDPNVDTLMFANNIRFDSAPPVVEEFTVNDLGWTNPADPLKISVEEPTTFRLLANDNYESGIVHAKITLAYDGPQGDEIVLLDKGYYPPVDNIEESITKDLSGYPLGDYIITVTLSDTVNSETYDYALALLSEEIIPKPLIAGFDFKVNPNCKDKIYAYTKGCYLPDGTQVPATGVRFEYKDDGGVWTDMGTDTHSISGPGLEMLWMVKYNVTGIDSIRTISYLELADTTYSQIGDPVNPADYTADSPMTSTSLRIVADDVAKVESINPVDFIIALTEKIDGTDNVANDEVEIIDISANNNVYVGDITQAGPGWIGEENGMVTLWMYSEVDGLTYTQFDVHKVTQSYGTNGEVTSYDAQMTANVPANAVINDAAIYFEPNENDIPDPDTLHTRVSVIENVYYNGTLPPVPDEMVVYTLKYDCPEVPTGAALEIYRYNELLNVWQIIDNPIFDGTEAEFSVPVGEDIFAVFLNTEGVLDLAISDEIVLEPGYENNYTTPTQNFVTTITYAGSQADLLVDVMLDDYYVIYENQSGDPGPGCGMTLDWCGIDEINHILTIENINIELDPSVEHTIEITVKDVYGNEDSNSLTFSIDDEAPIVSNDVYEGLTFSADIVDSLTEVDDVVLIINGFDINYEQLTITEDTYSYTFGYSELMDILGSDYGNVDVDWFVEDALDNRATYEFTYEYDLSINITFYSFEGGYWFNPTILNEFKLNVNVPEGVEIVNNGVVVDFHTDGVEPAQQENTMATDLGDGDYSVHYGGNYPPDATALTLIAHVATTAGMISSAQQNYGIDYAAPVVWAISPVGEPIDNDNDGLFNEDPPNGINDDQDWDDINGNGIRDMYQVSDTLWVWEPWKIDEDPVDFYPAEMPYGTDVVISVGFNDIPRYVTYDGIQYYSAASGIDTTGIQLLVNGIPQNGLIISNGILTYADGIMEAGHYFVNVIIPDKVGNIGSFNADYFNSWQFEFDIIAPAPTVEFQPLLVGGTETWFVDPYDDLENEFRFAINWKGNPEIVPNEVVVTYYEQGSEIILDGPRTIESTSIDSTVANYTDNLGSNVIDELTTGIILEVTATNIWGGTSTSRHTYMIMHSPELLFAKPDEMIFSSNPLRLNDGAKGTTSFNLALTRDAYVTVEIYNFAGKKVKLLKSNELIKRLTNNSVSWDGTNDDGNEVARGGYVTRIQATGVSRDVKGKTITKMLKIGVLK